jgi:hypothetical protein
VTQQVESESESLRPFFRLCTEMPAIASKSEHIRLEQIKALEFGHRTAESRYILALRTVAVTSP